MLLKYHLRVRWISFSDTKRHKVTLQEQATRFRLLRWPLRNKVDVPTAVFHLCALNMFLNDSSYYLCYGGDVTTGLYLSDC